MIKTKKEKTVTSSESCKQFSGKRIFVCGKGGSGKSSIVALMANVLHNERYKVMVLDGDASNPGGLARLMFGLKRGPKPLIELFGGREKVECPVDNPAPLTRLNDTIPVTEKNIEVTEIPSEYFIEKDEIILFQVGKIKTACEGCDGPMSKVTRDFIVTGDWVTLIDVEAGIEHFGRGVEKNIDIILVVVDPTFESFLIAEKVFHFCKELGKEMAWTILNKVQSEEMESVMIDELKKKKTGIIGTVHYDSGIGKTGLMGTALGKCEALEEVKCIVETLETECFGSTGDD
ncbi:MAG: adenylyl-sulfate kinase [Candidatus Kuenenia sp.]|nr:adenylyl-sulfate kinase [Candidatus Kuenenia hertensis]